MNEYLICYRPDSYWGDLESITILGDSKVEALMHLVNYTNVYCVCSVDKVKK